MHSVQTVYVLHVGYFNHQPKGYLVFILLHLGMRVRQCVLSKKTIYYLLVRDVGGDKLVSYGADWA